MTNDETKKKIADIIYHTGCTGACCECDYAKISEADTYCKALLKADALIAAGIGDVSEWKHRAEVAERALYNSCCEQNKHWCAQCDSFAECDTSNEVCIEAKKHAEELIKQAEKELAEESSGKKKI